MRATVTVIGISAVFWLAHPLCSRAADPATIHFEKQIRPLLIARCGKCHGPEKQTSGLRLDARHAAFKGGDGGPVIVPGNAGESELLRRIESEEEFERMPPEGPPLPAAEIALLRRWVDAGAHWPEADYDRRAAYDRRVEHWAYQPLRPVSPPDIAADDGAMPGALTAIDRFIAAKLHAQGSTLAPAADRRTLIRRLWLEMLGLPPSPEEVRMFLDDNDPLTWRKRVDAALASPRYGERWAQHWLDVVRYADTHGFEVNTSREHAWPYRDYVIRAFNADMPYDRFILEQLAGDALGADEATGFLVAAAVLLPGQIGKDEESKRLARQDALDEIVTGTGATFLGMTIGCARCHDHKFDPVAQRDYYALQAFFAGVEYGDRPIRSAAYRERLTQAAPLVPRIEQLEDALRKLEPRAFTGRTEVIDEADSKRVAVLKTPNGTGENPPGTDRGYKDDPGTIDRMSNVSGGRYTWWDNVPGEDVLAYRPGREGRFRVWISWGVHGSGVHTRDARYIFDADGDLATRGDQRELARVDQYYPAGVDTGETLLLPLWSGLRDVGIIDWRTDSKLVVRGGETGTGITADVIVLQEVVGEVADSQPDVPLPRMRTPVDPARNVERFAPVTAKFLRFTIMATIDNNRHEPCIDEIEVYTAGAAPRNLALAEAGGVPTSSGNYSETGRHQLRHINDGRYGNERSWISDQHGGGWVQIEFAEPAEVDRVVWGRDRNEKFRDRLPVQYRIEVSTDGHAWTFVAGHADRIPLGMPHDPIKTLLRNGSEETLDLPALIADIDRLKAEKARLETPQMIYGGTFREPDTTYVLRRGDPEQPVDAITPAAPVLFQAADIGAGVPEQQRRLALARWIASPENPLTARVMVNRIWQHHFGRGLVETPSDFGLNGTRPSHPELLDWLAGEFLRSGWSIKHIHRLILNSAVYRQSSRIEPRAARIDGNNRLLWRFAPRRLDAEVIRDSMLAVSGELNGKMGGPGFNLFQARGGLSGFPPVETFGPEELRRMIYAHKVRMESAPVFGVFDCPDAGQAAPLRSRSTTAIQALNLFNSAFVVDRARKLAARVSRDVASAGGPDLISAQVGRAYELALGRRPSEKEYAAAVTVAGEHGLVPVCRALLNSNEFLFLP